MHVFLSGIGGAGIGPLAKIALELGYRVSGTDQKESPQLDELRALGANIPVGQDGSQIAQIHNAEPIDWCIYGSAIFFSNPKNPELLFAQENQLKVSKRDQFLNFIISQANYKLLAIAGTHGKSTTTAMAVWLFDQLGLNPSWSVGAKLPFGPSGKANLDSEWFIYECDEFDKNFLAFEPDISLISGIAYDHHEIYPTEDSYNQAFRQFIDQSELCFAFKEDLQKLYPQNNQAENIKLVDEQILDRISLSGRVNQLDAALAVQAGLQIGHSLDELIDIINRFPGVSRRFETIVPGLISDYAHTPEKVAGCLEQAFEQSQDVVVLHEPLTDRRQHFIKQAYGDLFKGVKWLYWLPSYQAREHPDYPAIAPQQLIDCMNNPQIAEPAKLDQELKHKIDHHLEQGDLVIALSGGGAGSLDYWLRDNFKD